MWRRSVARLIWDQEAAGSNPVIPTGFSFLHEIPPPVTANGCGFTLFFFTFLKCELKGASKAPTGIIAPSPSGKAQHFDCCIRWFKSSWGSSASMAESADATDLKSVDSNIVWVQVPLLASMWPLISTAFFTIIL